MSMTFNTDVVVNTSGNSVKTNKILAPTTSGGTTYSAGSTGNVITSDGNNVYWADGSVPQGVSTSLKWRSLLLGVTQYNTPDTTIEDTSGQAYCAQDVVVQARTGTLSAPILSVASQCNLQWNSTDESVDFVFS